MMAASSTPRQAPTKPLSSPGIRRPDPAERRRSRLFRGGRLIDVADGRVRGEDVLVVEGRVQRVGPNLQVPDAETVDLDGRYVIPGLIDLHVHPGMMVDLQMQANGQTRERIKRDLQLWLRYGVTTVQSLGTDRLFAFDIQAEQARGTFTGARLVSVGNGFGVKGGAPPVKLFRMDPPGPVRPDDPAVAHDTVVALANRGASGVKLWYDDLYGEHPKMTRELAETIIQTCREVHLTSYAHVYSVDDAKDLIGYGLQVLAHMPRDREFDQDLIDLMRRRRVAVVPTLVVPESNVAYADEPAWVEDDPLFARFLPPHSKEHLRDDANRARIREDLDEAQWSEFEHARRSTEAVYQVIRRLGFGTDQAGVRLGFGTDAGVAYRVIGWSEHRELWLLVEKCGVRPADALRMATLGSAEILGRADELGQIAPGRRADLVVLRDNPLEAITNTRSIESVWLDGARVAGPLGP
jgi:imidazolonepropionase-like amidohydrolase